MEREFWSELSQAICEVDARWHDSPRLSHRTALVVRMHLWSVLHDRPTCWACASENWDARTRPMKLPDQSTLSRRKRHPTFERFMTKLSHRLAGKPSAALLKKVDGKPLTVAAHSKDRDARWGRGAGQQSKGYKLHAIWSDRPMPEQWALTPMNVCERTVARRMIKRLSGGGYLLGDSYFDDSRLHDLAAAVNHQLVAPRRLSSRGKGLGHCYHSPHRLRSLEITESPANVSRFGQTLHAQRRQIERDLGNLSSFGGGLTGLPPWARRIWRARHWVWGKMLINAARIRYRRKRVFDA